MSVPRLAPGTPVPAPDATVAAAARERLAGLATPAGALGRLGEAAVWSSAVQGACPPRSFDAVRLVVLAGDHGVSAHGVSAYPSAVTGLMVRAFVDGSAGAAVLARQHGVHLRVLDIAVDDALDGVPDEVRAHRVRRSSGAIHLEDALTVEETAAALAAGAAIAAEEVEAGADLLVVGDMGIGNTTPVAALVAGALGLPAEDVVGRGTGVDADGLVRKLDVVQRALERAGDRVDDPIDLLTALGSADLAATVAFLVTAARLRVPVLLDGVVSVACALVAERVAPGTVAWLAAGHRSTEPAQSLALDKLGLVPLLDLGLRLGEGSGALAALPLLRSSTLLLAQTALLADVLGQ
ncbi:nicotinate-nucleotide--dimethylbenzimidazole phosphoribosyltransferase [Solicola sp. PLA-1-18]|uniref:nicotinate-nucleotide--dimethylbenzimidazole phosphoribosyltransferase n=1 Tax=Solicola sp. PLA-1-18 TaxID=3380532 RepID=UPI003B765D66